MDPYHHHHPTPPLFNLPLYHPLCLQLSPPSLPKPTQPPPLSLPFPLLDGEFPRKTWWRQNQVLQVHYLLDQL